MKIYMVLNVNMIPSSISNKERKYYKKLDTAHVYILIKDNIPIYVGSSSQLMSRLHLHKKYVLFDKAIIMDFYEQEKFERLCEMEQYYIDKLNPILQRKLTWFETNYLYPELPVDFHIIVELYNKRKFSQAR